MNKSLVVKCTEYFSVPSIASGITAVLWYAFGAVPVFVGVIAVLGVTEEHASSWLFIIFATAGVSSIVLALRYQQPIAIGWTIPGLVFIGAAGRGYTIPEIVGANLVAGIVILLLGLIGVGSLLMRWLPLPLVLGMFVGSTLNTVIQMFDQLGIEPIVVGAVLMGYLGATALGRQWLPPVGGAVVLGLAGAVMTGQLHPDAMRFEPPAIIWFRPEFNPTIILELSVPLVVMAVGIGNVQGIGVLLSQGYRVPINTLTTAVGINSIVNALFGGHPSTVARAGVAIVAGEDAGPPDRRYVASLVAAVGALLLASSATTTTTLLAVFPSNLVVSLAAVAIVRTLLDSLRQSMAADLPMGAFFALAIAMSPLSIAGIGPAFWALMGGYLVSLIVERAALIHWTLESRANGTTS